MRRGAHVRRVSVFVAVSRFVARVHARHGIVAEVLPNFVPVRDGHGRLQFDDRDGVVFWGRLRPEKGVDDVIEMAKLLPGHSVVIAGSGMLEDHVRRETASLPNVHVTGYVSDDQLDEIVRKARVVVVPSRCHDGVHSSRSRPSAMGRLWSRTRTAVSPSTSSTPEEGGSFPWIPRRSQRSLPSSTTTGRRGSRTRAVVTPCNGEPHARRVRRPARAALREGAIEAARGVTQPTTLVTGGAGYVGSTRSLTCSRADAVRVLDSIAVGDGGSPLQFWADPRFEFVRGDVRDPGVRTAVLKEVDAVVHLAAVVGDPACKRDPERRAR